MDHQFQKVINPTKLPRRRKKAYIKKHGAANYNASRLFSINQNEYKGKFWKGFYIGIGLDGCAQVIPTSYW